VAKGAQCLLEAEREGNVISRCMAERLAGRYRGKRYSFGYGACPNLDDQPGRFRLLEAEEIGVRLSEGMMMDPEASVRAMVFHHPDCLYFNVQNSAGGASGPARGQKFRQRAEPGQGKTPGDEGEVRAVVGDEGGADSERAGGDEGVVAHGAAFLRRKAAAAAEQGQNGARPQADAMVGRHNPPGGLEGVHELLQDTDLTWGAAAGTEFHGDNRAHVDLRAAERLGEERVQIPVAEVVDQDIAVEDDLQKTRSRRGILPADCRNVSLSSSRNTASRRAWVTASVSVRAR